MNNQLSPHLQFFFLCDEIVQREDRQINVTGMLSHVLFTDAPLRMPPLHLTTKLVVGIYSADRFRAYTLRVMMQESGEPEDPLFNSQIGYIDGEYVPIKFQTYDLTFLKPGVYWFNAYLDNRLVGRYPLAIDYAPMSNS